MVTDHLSLILQMICRIRDKWSVEVVEDGDIKAG